MDFPSTINGYKYLEHLRTMQNVALKVSLGAEIFVMRLTHPQHRSIREINTEITLLNDLSAVTKLSIMPTRFKSGHQIESVEYLGEHYNGVLFPFYEAKEPNLDSYSTASRFGMLIAELHTALENLDKSYDLPVMKDIPKARHLIHGDFSEGNVLQIDNSFVVIDFENAGYSTFEYELANTIYMKLFANRHNLEKLKETNYTSGLLSGYAHQRAIIVDDVGLAIHTRIGLLKGWLLHPNSAPLAIASSSQEWKKELKNFIQAYESGCFNTFLQSVVAHS